MTRFVSARLLRRRVAPHLAPLVLVAVLIAALVAGVVGLPRALAASNDEQFAAALDPARSSASEITLSGEWAEPDGGARLQGSLSQAAQDFPALLREPLAGAVGGASSNIVLKEVLLYQRAAGGDDPVQVRLGVDADAVSNARVREGTAPAPWTGDGPLEIALVESAAARLGVSAGDRLSSAGLEMIVAGIVEPAPGDAVALRHREVFDDVTEERLQSGTAVLGVGALIDPASLDALDGFVFGAQLTAWYPVTSTGLEASDIGELASATRLAMSTGVILPSGQPLSVNSRLPPILDRVVTTSANTSALAWLLAAGVLGAIVVAVGGALRGFAGRRAVGRALMAARGAGTGRAVRDAASETALAAVPGAVVGAGVAVLALPGPIAVGDVAIAAVVALAITAWGALLAAPPPPAWRGPVRIGGDLLIVALGVGAAVLLTVRGFAPSDAGADPFLVSAPAWIAIAAGVLAGRALPYGLRAIERAGRTAASAGAGVARAWAARRPAAVAPLVAIVVALSACVSSLVVGQALADSFTTAADDAVGADARVVSASGALPIERIRAVPGVAAAVEVRVATGIGLTDDGRSRSADVLVADTAALHAIRPDLPALGPGEIAVGAELAVGIGGALELGGDIPVAARVVTANLPASADGRWVLVDERTLAGDALSGPVWVLCRWTAEPAADAPAALRAAAGDDATVSVADEVRADAAARPSAVVLAGVLWAGAVVPLALAALALVVAVVAVGPERERLRAVLRLLGLPPRGAALPVLWQVVPVVLAGSLVGAVVGVAVSSLVAAATDVAGIAGVVGSPGGLGRPRGRRRPRDRGRLGPPRRGRAPRRPPRTPARTSRPRSKRSSMNTQHPPLIECADVVRIYRSASVEVQALQGLNLRVDRGELTAIVGASGSGKSTLLGILSALDVASAGRVRVGDHDLMAMDAAERARYRRETAGFVWQQTTRNFVEGLSIRENVELAASLTGGGRTRRAQAVRDVVQLLGIAGIADRAPSQVTGGERQRAAIAVGLVNAPEVLFADEPTGELDEHSSAQVLEALRSVNAESGVTVLIVTHDPDVADHVRRTVQIRDGRTSTEVLRSTRVDEGGVERGIAEEFAVLDRAGRLQLPQDQLTRLGMRDRVRLGFRERHIEIHAGDRPEGDAP